MYIHCMYGLGSHPVPKQNIQIKFGLGSDRFSPIWCLRCYKTSSAIAKVGNSAHRTVYATSKRCLVRTSAPVKQVKTVEIFTLCMALDLEEEDDS